MWTLWQALIRGCATDQELNGWLSGCVLPLYGHIVGDQGRVIADAQAASDRVQKIIGRDAHTAGR